MLIIFCTESEERVKNLLTWAERESVCFSVDRDPNGNVEKFAYYWILGDRPRWGMSFLWKVGDEYLLVDLQEVSTPPADLEQKRPELTLPWAIANARKFVSVEKGTLSDNLLAIVTALIFRMDRFLAAKGQIANLAVKLEDSVDPQTFQEQLAAIIIGPAVPIPH